MKQFIYSVCMALGIGVSGCSLVETEMENGGGNPVILGVRNANLETKSIFTTVGTGTTGNVLNKIAVGVTANSNVSWYDTDVTRQLFKTQGTDAVTWMAEGTPLYLNDTKGTVYAWAPSDLTATFTAGAPLKLTGLTLSAVQTFDFTNQDGVTDWNTSEKDYLYSAPVSNINKNNSSAALNMSHALSKVSFRVMRNSGLPAPGTRDYVKEVKLVFKADGGKTGFVGKGEIDLNTGDIKADDAGRLSTITFSPKTSAGSRQVAAYAVSGSDPDFVAVSPQAFALVAPYPSVDKGKVDVVIKVGMKDSDTYDRTFTTTASTELNWQKGKHYIYTILLTEKALTISSVTLVGWSDELKDPVSAE
ncbi:fimbrillin family protein [uncultured Parabacteroides sp.]|jgi:hypothetical protein|uniref:fimbrillin family protein n=1 Tax=uncultured Parabacteroides sp. TaxID=512312 RepID=UPI0025F2BB21|nr:fimbrillin family protein [uncultured Parabacteroides sp.]